MSSGTPVGGGYMRQRHSQGYASGSDDLEDDASSRSLQFPQPPSRVKSWVEIAENVLWLASALFIIYFGDRHSNLIYLLWHDDRIRRLPLYLGMVGVGLNCAIFMYATTFSQEFRRFEEKWESFSVAALPFSFALWPIWSFLTLPLLFSLFMACTVIFPHVMAVIPAKPNDALRID